MGVGLGGRGAPPHSRGLHSATELALQPGRSGAACRPSAKNNRTEHRRGGQTSEATKPNVPSSRPNFGSSKRRETTSNSSWEPPFLAWRRVVWPARGASVTVELRGFARSRRVRQRQIHQLRPKQWAPLAKQASSCQTAQLLPNRAAPTGSLGAAQFGQQKCTTKGAADV